MHIISFDSNITLEKKFRYCFSTKSCFVLVGGQYIHMGKVREHFFSDEMFNLFKPSTFMWGIGKQCKPDQTPQNASSDQVLHCLPPEYSIKIQIKIKNTTQQPLKQKWTVPIDKVGNFIRYKSVLSNFP